MNYDAVEKYLFFSFALLFMAAGGHHLYEYFVPDMRPNYPPLRHLIFVGINLVLAYFMLNRTVYFLPILIIISAQQLYARGGSLIRNWSGLESVAYTDWVVVLMAPVLLLAYS